MADLDQVVELHAAADDGRVGLGPVDAGVGADLDVVFDDHVAQLGDLVESAGGIGHESEAVGADYCAGVEDAAAAHRAPFVDLHPGVEDRPLADGDPAAQIDLRVDLAAAADPHALLDDREVADVALFAHGGALFDRGAGADALAAGLGGVVHLEQLEDAGSGVGHLDEGGRNGLRRCEIAVHQDDGRLGRIEKGFVFRIGQVGQRAGLSLLDRGDGVHRRGLVAYDLAAQKSGDHFSSEFHHGLTFSWGFVRGIFRFRCLREGTPPRCGRTRAPRGPSMTRCRPRGPE